MELSKGIFLANSVDPDQMPQNAESLFIFSTGSFLQTYIKQNKTDTP